MRCWNSPIWWRICGCGALFGQAQVAEVTGGGKLEPAITAYRQVAEEFPDTPFAELAGRRAEALEAPDAAQFYAWFAQQNFGPKDMPRPNDPGRLESALPTTPGSPGGPAMPDDAATPAGAAVETPAAGPMTSGNTVTPTDAEPSPTTPAAGPAAETAPAEEAPGIPAMKAADPNRDAAPALPAAERKPASVSEETATPQPTGEPQPAPPESDAALKADPGAAVEAPRPIATGSADAQP